MAMVIQVLLLILGFVMLIKGADWFVDGAAGIAGRFGIPQLVIGLTIVAMGTSAPEAAVSITAAMKGSAALTIGNVVGSNILNILIILGLTAVITTVRVAQSTIRFEIPFMIFVSLLLMLLSYTGLLSFGDGLILWGAFLLYLIYLFRMAKKNQQAQDPDTPVRPLWQLIGFTLIGLVLIVWGSDVTVNAASAIASALGMSERFIGLTIVALGTSLPELFTSVNAARKGNADIAIGNIVGSNVFNILFVAGTTALIIPVPCDPVFLIDMAVAAAAAVLLWLFAWRQQGLGKAAGITMLAGYAAYFVYLLR